MYNKQDYINYKVKSLFNKMIKIKLQKIKHK
jgi:hypothetical protein